MNEIQEFEKNLGYLGQDLIKSIIDNSKILEAAKDTELVKEGQYIKYIPIMLKGLVKVTTRLADKELLLYYIKPYESCVMSFSASLKNEKSKIYATTEEDSTVILIPSDMACRME